MISIAWMFYLLIGFFAVVGALRGWQREVIALAGLIGSIAALNQFGYTLVDLGNRALSFFNSTQEVGDIYFLDRRFFWVQFFFHIFIAFFSYQVIARIADSAGGRFGDRLRIGFQRRFIGGFLGTLNGYLLIGTLWGFLEYQLTPNGYIRLAAGSPYIFDPEILTRPILAPTAFDLAAWLPFGLINPNVWLLLFFLAFFIVIIALI